MWELWLSEYRWLVFHIWVSVFETSLRYDSAILHLLRILKWKMHPTQHIRKMYKLGILVQEYVSQCIWLLYCLHTKFGDVQKVKVGRREFAFSFSMNHSNLSAHMQEYSVKRMTAHTHWSSWSVELREWRAGLDWWRSERPGLILLHFLVEGQALKCSTPQYMMDNIPQGRGLDKCSPQERILEKKDFAELPLSWLVVRPPLRQRLHELLALQHPLDCSNHEDSRRRRRTCRIPCRQKPQWVWLLNEDKVR